MLQGSSPEFPAKSTALVPTKRQRRIHQPVGVDPHRPGLQPPRDVMRFLDIPCPYSGGQSVLILIRHLDDLIQVIETQRSQHWAEDLLPRDLHVVTDISKNCWLD